MASTTPIAQKTVTKELALPLVTNMPFIRIFSDGSVERPLQTPFVPPTLNDPNHSSKDIVIPNNPAIPSRIYLPKITNPSSKLPILVYFHGGAFLFESAFSQLYHEHLKKLASQANVIIVSIDYQLAPEYPLPTCYHDCWAALKWVSSHSNNTLNNADREPWLIEHGDFNKIFIGGDSAGANIAHNMAIQAGIELLPFDVKILGAIIIHPYVYSSYPIGSEPIIEPENNIAHKIWNLVYPNAPFGIDNPFINPLGEGAPNLEKLGCSRIIVFVAGKDFLRDRGVWYFESVKKSGWKGKLELFEEKDEDHVYHLLKPESESAKIFLDRLVSFFQETIN